MTPGSQKGIRQDTAGVISLYWGSDWLGRNHTGKQGLRIRPVLSVLGDQSRVPRPKVWLGSSQQKQLILPLAVYILRVKSVLWNS